MMGGPNARGQMPPNAMPRGMPMGMRPGSGGQGFQQIPPSGPMMRQQQQQQQQAFQQDARSRFLGPSQQVPLRQGAQIGQGGPSMGLGGAPMGQAGPMGPRGPMGHATPMGPGGSMGPGGPMVPGGSMGPGGPMGQTGGPMSQPGGPMGQPMGQNMGNWSGPGMMNGARFPGPPGGSGGSSDQRSVASPHAHGPGKCQCT